METTIRKFKAVIQFLMRTHGQDLVEYALLVALIGLAATAGMKTLATDINGAFTNVSTKLTSYVNSGGGGTTGGQTTGGQTTGGQTTGGQTTGGQTTGGLFTGFIGG